MCSRGVEAQTETSNAGNDKMRGGKGRRDIAIFAGNGPVRVDLKANRADTPSGTDRVFGVEGIVGSRAGDVLLGDGAMNFFWGRLGPDTIRGRGGPDRIFGESGDDQLFGEGGNDRIFGGQANDLLDGGAGDDFLDGGPGEDILIGGPGTDDCRRGEATGCE